MVVQGWRVPVDTVVLAEWVVQVVLVPIVAEPKWAVEVMAVPVETVVPEVMEDGVL